MTFEQIKLFRDIAHSHSVSRGAHLNSIRKVQEVQDGVLSALGIRELRDKINDALIKASDEAAQYLYEIEKADDAVLRAKDLINETH